MDTQNRTSTTQQGEIPNRNDSKQLFRSIIFSQVLQLIATPTLLFPNIYSSSLFSHTFNPFFMEVFKTSFYTFFPLQAFNYLLFQVKFIFWTIYFFTDTIGHECCIGVSHYKNSNTDLLHCEKITLYIKPNLSW